MSEATRAVLLAGVIGAVILLVPIALLAAGVIGGGTMIGIQIGVLVAIYLVALSLKNRRS